MEVSFCEYLALCHEMGGEKGGVGGWGGFTPERRL